MNGSETADEVYGMDDAFRNYSFNQFKNYYYRTKNDYEQDGSFGISNTTCGSNISLLTVYEGLRI